MPPLFLGVCDHFQCNMIESVKAVTTTVSFFKFLQLLLKGMKFRGAHKREICWIKEEYHIFFPHISTIRLVIRSITM